MDDLSTTDERCWALLDSYLAGTCSAEEAEVVRSWVDRTPVAAALSVELTKISVHTEVDATPFEPEILFRKIEAEMASAPSLSLYKNKPSFFRASYRTFALGAFCAVLGLALGLFGHRISTDALSKPGEREYTTTRGQQINITLDDGTEVWLAPSTRLRYSESGKNSPRTVELDGEAVFVVQHASSSPFVVRSNGVDLRVLGTTFGVRGYTEDTAVRVAILDGKVAVKDRVLAPGDIAWASETRSEVVIQSHQPVSTLTGWRSGQLIFVSERLETVLPTLSRWYNLDFVLADSSLEDRRITATLATARITSQDLEFLSVSLGVKYTQSGRTVTFYPQNL